MARRPLRNVVVILAGGVGMRVGLGIPKQLIKIAGKAIVEHTLEAVCRHAEVDEVIIMMNSDSLSELDYLKGAAGFEKLSRILPGGATRNESTTLAIEALGPDECNVLFHDAVRPFIDDRIISDCLRALESFDAVDTAIPSADTIIQVDDDDIITGIPDRSYLRRGQTPQAFKLSTIRRAYELAAQDPGFHATDDCGVVFTYLPDVRIAVVAGSVENMKVTEPLDIDIADKIFQLQSTAMPADDSELLSGLEGKTVVVFGGSYGIGRSLSELSERSGARVHAFSRSATGTDVRSEDDIRDALRRAHELDGRIDAVVVTAGVLTVSPLLETPASEMRATIETNLVAPAVIAKLAHPYLAETQGHLTLFTSSSYTRGRADYALYSATKAGVVNLMQALSEEWADSRIHVNCINPQRTDTPMRRNAFGDEPRETLLTPENVATACARLLASDTTGQVISVRMDRK